MDLRHVTYMSAQTRCAADLYLPDGVDASAPVPGLVLGHSHVKEALSDPARYLAEAGFVVLAIDYRTFGGSEGEPRGQMFPERQVDDFRSAVTYLSKLPEVDADRIGVWGVTMGAALAVQAAILDRRIKCVVGQSPIVMNGWRHFEKARSRQDLLDFLDALQQDWERRNETGEGARIPFFAPDDSITKSYAERALDIYPNFPKDIVLESMEHVLMFAPEHFIERLAPTPLLMVANGGYDPNHLLDEVQIAFRKADEPKRLEVLPYDVVGLYLEPGLGEAMGLAIDWFDRYLRRSPLPGRSPSASELEER